MGADGPGGEMNIQQVSTIFENMGDITPRMNNNNNNNDGLQNMVAEDNKMNENELFSNDDNSMIISPIMTQNSLNPMIHNTLYDLEKRHNHNDNDIINNNDDDDKELTSIPRDFTISRDDINDQQSEILPQEVDHS